MGRGLDVKDAPVQAEHFARAAGAMGDVVRLGPMWAKAARAAHDGEPLWPRDRAARREAEAREMEDANDGPARSSVIEFTQDGRLWKGFYFIPAGGGECAIYALIAIRGGKVRAKILRQGGAVVQQGMPERIDLDAADIAREGRSWCRALRCFVYAHPTVWPAWKAWEANRPAGIRRFPPMSAP
jgi:hypothetical protein